MTIDEVFQGWQKFSEVLMTDNRELFEKMVADLNVEALESLDLGKEPFELVAMTLIFQQQKMIAWLLNAIEKSEAGHLIG